jgi:transcriptional regulator with XRE-family HTH domain
MPYIIILSISKHRFEHESLFWILNILLIVHRRIGSVFDRYEVDMTPGLRLRQVRERLGLTYRDVERCSFELAAQRGRPDFVLHISRLADIENRGVVPTVHKMYTLAAVYHLSPLELFRWYEVPIEELFGDALASPAPRSHLMAPPVAMRLPIVFDPAFDPRRTEFLSRMVSEWGELEGIMTTNRSGYHRYGYIGLGDRRMMPMLRPGSVVLVDARVRQIEDSDWVNEYDRPMYFVDVRDGYRCGWFQRDGAKLTMQPHPLSRCLSESWRCPDDAEIVGRVVGIVSRLNEPWTFPVRESREATGYSNRKAP